MPYFKGYYELASVAFFQNQTSGLSKKPSGNVTQPLLFS